VPASKRPVDFTAGKLAAERELRSGSHSDARRPRSTVHASCLIVKGEAVIHYRRTPCLCSSAIGLIGILALVGLLAAPAAAQETGGSIRGTIMDAQNAVLPGVTITLRNLGTNAVQNTVTNDQGAYALAFVPIGRYTLTAELQGFSTAKQEEFEVRVGDRLLVNLKMQVGAVSETINVTAESLLPAQISRMMLPLDDREREILALRFGLDRGEARTLEEVGEHFGLTRERIRQIEARAMSKLRHPSSDTGARDLLNA